MLLGSMKNKKKVREVANWYNRNAISLKEGLIYESIFEEALTKCGFEREKDFLCQFSDDKLYSIPDFYVKNIGYFSIKHFTAKTASNKVFWETIDQLFEIKSKKRKNVRVYLILFGSKMLWISWLLQGFESVFDKVFYLPGPSILEIKKGPICRRLMQRTINVIMESLGKPVNTKVTELWRLEKERLKEVLKRKEQMERKIADLGPIPDYYRNMVNLLKLSEIEIKVIEKASTDGICRGENLQRLFSSQDELALSLKKLQDLGLIQYDPENGSCKAEPFLEEDITDLLRETKIIERDYMNNVRNHLNFFKNIRHLSSIIKELTIVMERTRDFTSPTKELARLIFDGSRNRSKTRNWPLVILIEAAKLKREGLRRLVMDRGTTLPFVYFYCPLSYDQCYVIAKIIKYRLRKIKPSLEEMFQRLYRREEQKVHRKIPVTPTVAATSLQLRRYIPSEYWDGYPKKRFVTMNTFFKSLIPGLRGMAGRLGRHFTIRSSGGKILLHTCSARRNTVQHRVAEHCGMVRCLRYRYVNGCFGRNNEIYKQYFILSGVWRPKDLMRLFEAGYDDFFIPERLSRKWKLTERVLNDIEHG